ncbi:MAG: hypothetical protein AB1631_11425 [Acidobacteriota bacterium]
MRQSKWILFLVLALALAQKSDGQQTRQVSDQLKLAAVMPRGPLVYVQARDLAALMKTWLASPVRAQFYDSPSFKAFSTSHVYLKFQDRKADIEKATGIGIDESRLAEFAGGASALSIYDIGKLEMVFVTEVARERAIATLLFKQLPQFQERSADGASYYAREFTTDNGNLNQQFCFAYSDGKLIVTSTEGLMIRALKNSRQSGEDSALADVMATAQRAAGFSANEVTIWLDQAKLNQNRLFRSYWIHKDAPANIQSGLIDLRITPQGLGERRWFVLKNQTNERMLTADQASALMRMAPADAQLVEARSLSASREELNRSISQTFFGKLPDDASIPNQFTDHSTSDEGARTERYSRLDTRFDMDVDDETAPRAGGKQSSPVKQEPAAAQFEKAVDAIIAAAAPAGYCEMVRSRVEAGRPFVRFERAIVIEMNAAGMDRAAFERAITDEMRQRFVVAGIDPNLQWQDDAGVRYLAQSLLEQGAAYSVSGRYLVLSSSREFARDILRAATAASQARIDGPALFYALVRISDARPVFDTLMKKLDGPSETTEGEEPSVRFFSDNLSSLIAATAFREMRIRRETAGDVMTERVVYSW